MALYPNNINRIIKKMSRKNSAPQTPEPVIVKKSSNNMVMYAVIFIAGFLSGIAFTIYKTGGTAPVNVANQQQQQQQEHQHDPATDQAILNLEAEVTARPDNFENWVQLGNLYFDSDHPEKAIPAYEKALEIHSGNANVYTDLGVMYRRANQPKKAVDAFDQAIAKDANHIQSRFNRGIVLMYDLDDASGAIASWESILDIDPNAKTGNGESISSFIERIKNEIAAKKP
ncbi:MAG: cytochrome c-type biogenesis protein CcmH/NrfG [Desulforhopalus sp.]|jgi:cytochrome c-type biogenesis protein CcmH/NrfG